jgi:broad specificity phosphatase PhoE
MPVSSKHAHRALACRSVDAPAQARYLFQQMLTGTTLLLVRHGHTADNGDGLQVRMSGKTDVPLSSEGVRQSVAIARHLSVLLASGGPLHTYSSPLQRTLHTASFIAAGFSTTTCVEPGLSEIDCGEADGLPMTAVMERYPQAWARNLAQADAECRWPGGESYREFRERSLGTIRRIAERHGGERVIVVTHAGLISQVLGWLQGENPARWSQFRPRNGSVTELEWRRATARLVHFDEVPAQLSGPGEVSGDTVPSRRRRAG